MQSDEGLMQLKQFIKHKNQAYWEAKALFFKGGQGDSVIQANMLLSY